MLAEENDGSKPAARAGSKAWKVAPPAPLEPKPMSEPPSGFMALLFRKITGAQAGHRFLIGGTRDDRMLRGGIRIRRSDWG
jgi:hypothetical protein